MTGDLVPRRKVNEYLARAQSRGNQFSIRRDLVTAGVLTKMEALFLHDLINHTTRKKMRWLKVEGLWYFLCTVTFMWKSFRWDRNIQARLLKALSKKGFLKTCQRGKYANRRRWICLDLLKLEECLDEKKQSSSKNDDGESSKNDEGTSSNDDRMNNKEMNNRPRRSPPPRPWPNGMDDQPSTPTETDPLVEEFDLPCARRLAETLFKKGKAMRSKVNLTKWAAEFTKLRKAGVKRKRIKVVLDWFLENVGGYKVPETYSAASFCLLGEYPDGKPKGFIQVENAMDRKVRDDEQKKANRDPNELTSEEKWGY